MKLRWFHWPMSRARSGPLGDALGGGRRVPGDLEAGGEVVGGALGQIAQRRRGRPAA